MIETAKLYSKTKMSLSRNYRDFFTARVFVFQRKSMAVTVRKLFSTLIRTHLKIAKTALIQFDKTEVITQLTASDGN